MKIWDAGYYSADMEVTFDARFLEFGLGSIGALCKSSDFTTPLRTFIRFIQILRYPKNGAIHAIFCDLPKIKKNMAF